MVAQTKISVPLTHDEFIALASVATREMRHPKDQARFLLRRALGFDCAEPRNGGHGRQNESRAEQSVNQ